MSEVRALVCVIDDDESVRESLPDLLTVLGFEARAFSSAEEFLASEALSRARCVIVDVAMPGMSGPELQLELTRAGHSLPLIFITARIDEEVRRNVMKRGAVACLYKPFSESALLDALQLALGSAGV
ncbi:MAG: response regulator [Polyangiales bacterium]